MDYGLQLEESFSVAVFENGYHDYHHGYNDHLHHQPKDCYGFPGAGVEGKMVMVGLIGGGGSDGSPGSPDSSGGNFIYS